MAEFIVVLVGQPMTALHIVAVESMLVSGTSWLSQHTPVMYNTVVCLSTLLHILF
jgi:hypothetical protein